MIKRSRANRTERATFRNIRNEHKFIDVVHHGDGHYYISMSNVSEGWSLSRLNHESKPEIRCEVREEIEEE